MKNIWIIIGAIFVIGGFMFGLYMGIWWAIVGGLVQIISQIGNDPVVAMEVFKGLVKIFLSGLIGLVSAIIPMTIGMQILNIPIEK